MVEIGKNHSMNFNFNNEIFLDNRHIGLYIHIPFCFGKCHYCSFNSIVYSSDLLEEYINSIKEEIRFYGNKQWARWVTVQTIYIGGGTPSILSVEDIQSILETLNKFFQISSDAEITLEANPESLTQMKTEKYIIAGINRLSIGIQSLDDDILKRIGRRHTSRIACRAYNDARNNGFSNINVDLIYGLPRQNSTIWQETLDGIIQLKPEHISIYGLGIEEGSKFFQDKKQGRLLLPEEDEQVEFYNTALAFTRQAGYEHYEISNFAKPNFRSKHNQIYWAGDEYLGLGAGAHSYLGGWRFNNISSPGNYNNLMHAGLLPVESTEKLSVEKRLGEKIILRLRMMEGIKLEMIRKRFGFIKNEEALAYLQKFIDTGLITIDADMVKLTEKGILLSNEVFAELI